LLDLGWDVLRLLGSGWDPTWEARWRTIRLLNGEQKAGFAFDASYLTPYLTRRYTLYDVPYYFTGTQQLVLFQISMANLIEE